LSDSGGFDSSLPIKQDRFDTEVELKAVSNCYSSMSYIDPTDIDSSIIQEIPSYYMELYYIFNPSKDMTDYVNSYPTNEKNVYGIPSSTYGALPSEQQSYFKPVYKVKYISSVNDILKKYNKQDAMKQMLIGTSNLESKRILSTFLDNHYNKWKYYKDNYGNKFYVYLMEIGSFEADVYRS